MRNVPSAVVIVTSELRGKPVGATIGSFTSLSLNPPLVSFNVMQDTRLCDALLDSGRLNVHVLLDDQATLAERFAVPNLDGSKIFADVDYEWVPKSIPKLWQTGAVLGCSVVQSVQTADHSLFVCRVDEVEHLRDGTPLLHFNRSYRTVGPKV
ncbi:MAG: flavin reductase family protein [Rubricoccaceae bacterium]|nr:flavin reductase family protein [Rubricoccaceae bacterium]